ncbi:MAG: bifunctional proline dehydrogenase/L-glutamate gamma-semialdehyde dehydrogenase [Campylobacter sp.]|nr:bifunctional proline dehydrogenase/L-glutamate gamma-semialdehyde dehydrogenase [Campylobacter sp.]
MIQKSLNLANSLQESIEAHMTASEKSFHQKMQKLLQNPESKVMLISLLDQSFRSSNKAKNFELIEHTLGIYGVADFFTPYEKFLLFCFLNFGKLAPSFSVPFFVSHIKKDTAAMVLDANEEFLKPHIKQRSEQNITLNLNFIGEEVLGAKEATYRIQKYEEAIKSDFITYISIKITTIFSQISALDFEYSKSEIVKRLKSLYTLARSEEQRQGKRKFINLDMEEYKDLELTVAAFKEAIDEFGDLEAGIVLQAYIPNSFLYLKELFEFSKQRVKDGKKPIKIRFVKGANMEAEETLASQKGWELPTFTRKVDTDSNYNKMLHFILENDNYKFIKIGIASHNIFEIAYAYTIIKEKDAIDSFTFEMLEGMSMQASFELSKLHQLILYAPVCDDAHFNNAIAYLVRRLDENTAQDNFMRHFFGLKVGDKNWQKQKELFLSAIKNIDNIDNTPRKTQDRNAPSKKSNIKQTGVFVNEPDTDFVLKTSRKWANKIKDKFTTLPKLEIWPNDGIVTTGGVEIYDKIEHKAIATINQASPQGIDDALQIAKNSSYSNKSFDEIHTILNKVASLFRDKRDELIGTAALEVGKTFAELDAEVSEAIDFLEFYPHSLQTLIKQNPHNNFTPKGIGVVIAPWNFPIGIPTGTIAAPLAAGNRVIFKPSSLSSLTGYKICEIFWEAGIPKDALIYLPSKGSDISKYLLIKDEIKFCILTGGEETAYKMLEANPKLILSAETGGKNATIVTALADRDQAVKNVVHSAFSNSGQKCSATSLLILEDEVYDDENFKNTLIDATNSLNIGSPFDFKNKIAAMCDKPDDKITKAINELKPYEEWAIKPAYKDGNEYLMKPSIKYGTKVGDFTHKTELFAPILTVMRARDLKEAVDIANQTGYGLTAGLESLDEREWEYFTSHIEAGNIYINKPTTGAIVLRQPFGGIKKSAIGFGRKVGIYNYITQFVDISQNESETNLKECEFDFDGLNLSGDLLNSLKSIAQSYKYHYDSEFSQTKEYIKVRGEENLFSYTPIKSIGFRVSKNDEISDILAVIIASKICNVKLSISYEDEIFGLENFAKNLGAVLIKQSDKEFANSVENFERIRYSGESDEIYKSAAKLAKIIIRHKPLLNGRFELLYYFNEKSVSVSYHRYGNLGRRALG